jgi:hypothetical protein
MNVDRDVVTGTWRHLPRLIEAPGRKSIEIRCPKECGCSRAPGRLLVQIMDVPDELFGSGAVVEVACPAKKSRLIRVIL